MQFQTILEAWDILTQSHLEVAKHNIIQTKTTHDLLFINAQKELPTTAELSMIKLVNRHSWIYAAKGNTGAPILTSDALCDESIQNETQQAYLQNARLIDSSGRNQDTQLMVRGYKKQNVALHFIYTGRRQRGSTYKRQKRNAVVATYHSTLEMEA